MVIISASGMCEAGRILHHLRNNVADARNTVLIVGYCADHTLGKRIVEHRPEVHADRERYARMLEPVRFAVGNGAVGEERGVAAPARLQEYLFPLHAEERFLLSAKAGSG